MVSNPEITPEAQRSSHYNCDQTKSQIRFKFKGRLFIFPITFQPWLCKQLDTTASAKIPLRAALLAPMET